MEENLYLKIQDNLVRGYNIQTLEYNSWVNKDGAEVGTVVITYLYGQKLRLNLKSALSVEDLNDILSNINEIQEVGCYPQGTSTCELGITSLN